MAIAWVYYRGQIRRTILRDTNPANYRWSDEILRDCLWWALDQFASHTAQATATSFTGDGVTTQFDLPENVYDAIDESGMVYIQDGTRIKYLDPVRNTEGLTPNSDTGFYIWPNNKINMSPAPVSGSTITIEYFASYNRPYADSDTVDIPRWAEKAVSYLVAANALVSPGLKSANIRQWGQKPDTGTPEDNSLKEFQRWLVELYYEEINRHPSQERTNAFRRLNSGY